MTNKTVTGEPRLGSFASWLVLAASFGLSAATWIAIAVLGLLLAGVVGGSGSVATGARSSELPTAATETSRDSGPTASSYPPSRSRPSCGRQREASVEPRLF